MSDQQIDTDGELRNDSGGNFSSTTDRSATATGIGSSAQIQRVLDDAREVLAASHNLRASTRLLLGRSDELAEALMSEVRTLHGLRTTLRASVTAYVRRLRNDNTPPERVLVLVKSVVAVGTPFEFNTEERRTLMEDVVRWSVAAYYAA